MAENNGKLVSLPEKISRLCDQVSSFKEELGQLGIQHKTLLDLNANLSEEAARLPVPLSDRRCCVICQMPRLTPDITGLTCGEYSCLSRLQEAFREQEEESVDNNEGLKDLIVQIGDALSLPDFEKLTGSSDFDPIEYLKKIQTAVDDIREALKEISD